MKFDSAVWDIILQFAKSMLRIWPAWAWFPPVLILILWLRRPKIKGKIGENRVQYSLKGLPEDKYFILNDVLLKSESGTAQIDHIVVSVYGIFVIETKNMQGQMYGSEKSSNWTQNIYGNKYSFKNPIHQNYGHIKAVEKALSGYGGLPIYSIIAFSENADLHVKSDKTPVVYISAVSSCIRALATTESIPEIKAKEIFEMLGEKDINDKETRREHISEAKFKKHSYEEKAKQGICPRCGGNLVVRQGKRGLFIGCSNFPKCRFTQSIN